MCGDCRLENYKTYSSYMWIKNKVFINFIVFIAPTLLRRPTHPSRHPEQSNSCKLILAKWKWLPSKCTKWVYREGNKSKRNQLQQQKHNWQAAMRKLGDCDSIAFISFLAQNGKVSSETKRSKTKERKAKKEHKIWIESNWILWWAK